MKYKWDIIVMGIILLTCLLLLCLVFVRDYSLDNSESGNVEVYIDGEVYGIYSLNLNQTVNIESSYGNNILVIESKEAYIKDADCFSRECINMGKISVGNECIVCLPHHLTVRIQESSKEEYDAITN